MKLESMDQLFRDEIADAYSAEKQLIGALPKVVKAAHAPALKRVVEDHLEETREQFGRLDRILASLQERPKAKTCKAMSGLLKEAAGILKASGTPAVIDAAIIGAAQRVKHYEIAAYGCARTYAEMLGLDEAVNLLDQSLAEEKAADEALNELALGMINQQAANA